MLPQNSTQGQRPSAARARWDFEGSASEARPRVDYPRNLGENNKGSPQEHPCPRTMGLWRSWERASMAWKRSSVRSRPGPPIPIPLRSLIVFVLHQLFFHSLQRLFGQHSFF